MDVHRATDALLAGIDAVAAACPGVLFVTTTNFPDAVDEAFLSRADLVLHVPLPDAETVAAILRASLRELAALWPGLRPLAEDDALLRKLAATCAGLGRPAGPQAGAVGAGAADRRGARPGAAARGGPAGRGGRGGVSPEL